MPDVPGIGIEPKSARYAVMRTLLNDFRGKLANSDILGVPISARHSPAHISVEHRYGKFGVAMLW